MNRIIVIANADETASVLKSHRRRVEGTKASNATAAIPERSPATCQPLKAIDLTATPPVENSTEANINRIRSDARCESIEVMARPGEGGNASPENLPLAGVLALTAGSLNAFRALGDRRSMERVALLRRTRKTAQ